MTEEHIQVYIEYFYASKGLNLGDSLPFSDLKEFAKMFISVVDANGLTHLEVRGFLMWIHGILLQNSNNLFCKHQGKKPSEVPELLASKKTLDEFERFVTVYLGFDYSKGEWIDRKDGGERLKTIIQANMPRED